MGNTEADDSAVEHLARTIFAGTREQAADAAARCPRRRNASRSRGRGDFHSRQSCWCCMIRAAASRTARPQKPSGCVHGDSVGVHASDAANAWRNIARVSNSRNTVASLIVGAYHTAGQTDWVTKDPYPFADVLDKTRCQGWRTLLGQAEEAIKDNDQARACAVVHRYGELKLPTRPVFDLLVKYAVSEDGALHAEKYYRTVTEEFASTRPLSVGDKWLHWRVSPPANTAFPRPAIRKPASCWEYPNTAVFLTLL